MAKAKKRKDTKRNSFIKGISTNKNITEEHIGVYESIDYPLFSFKYLQEHSRRAPCIPIKWKQHSTCWSTNR